ncbi:MAG: ABC transporter ATP-binding protein [Proteobacteria bacterium]|nr:ABC transporter ATP-binding protein [Pseudomonadota bacterium]
MHEVHAKEALFYIYKMIRPFYWSFTIMLLVAIAWAIDLSLRPYLLKVILDRLNQSPSQEAFKYIAYPLLIYFFLSFFHTSMFRLYNYFVEIKMIPALHKKITNSIFSYMIKHDHSYYQNNFSGSLANKINDLKNSIPDIVRIFIDRFLSHILGLAVAIFTLWHVRIEFALAMLTWTLLFIGVAFFCSKRIQHLADKQSELGSTVTGKLVDILSNILSVKLFSRQRKEKESLNETLQEALKAERKLQWFYFWMWIFYGYSFLITQGICLYFLIKGREQGIISIGDFALVMSLNISIVDFLWGLMQEFSQFSKLLGVTIQALRTTTMPHKIKDSPKALELMVTKGKIVFDKVQFYYKGAEPLFNKSSITIFPSQKVGLVGFSGSGKSTFVNLILRLFDVTEGRILIDDQDIKNVTQDSLREAISIIPQDPSLFHRTLMENIRYGKLEASDEEVIEASQRAHAHEFISKLPLRYDSLVGERGIKLSGGQRQRIAMSRAILKNAPILILDEATSQLDSVTEHEIQESLWNLMKEKTTIIIAHRLSTLLRMDRILVFDQGKIIQDGPHKELLKGGFYKTLWETQIGGFLPEKKDL